MSGSQGPKYFGAPAKSFRMALGALIIKARMGLTDEELVEQTTPAVGPINTIMLIATQYASAIGTRS